MKRFIVNKTFEHEGKEYAQGAIYDVTPDIEMLIPLWITADQVRDPDQDDDDQDATDNEDDDEDDDPA
jgi:hypothetical protein